MAKDIKKITSVSPVSHAVAEAMQTLLEGKLPRKLAVAVSGGADSMALTLLLKEWAEPQGITLVALTVDHGLRKESAKEAKQVAKWMQALKVPHHILRWQGKKPGSNIQAAAREARYGLMEEWCAAEGITHLCTAHHLEDQAETVFLRLLRGSGVEGLSAMQPVSPRGKLMLLRPVLRSPRAQLREILEAKGQPWLEDPSNHDPAYARTIVRKFLETLPEEAARHISTAAGHLQRSAGYLRTRIAEDAASCVILYPAAGAAMLTLPKFQPLHPEARYKILTALVRQVGGEKEVRFEDIARLEEALTDQGSFAGATLGGCVLIPARKQRQKGSIYIYRERPDAIVTVKKSGEYLWDNRLLCTVGKLPGKGPYMLKAAGAEGIRQLLAQKAGLPDRPKRVLYTLPALWHLDKVIMAPHIKGEGALKVRWAAVQPILQVVQEK